MIAIEYIMHYNRIMYNSAAAGNDLACNKKSKAAEEKRQLLRRKEIVKQSVAIRDERLDPKPARINHARLVERRK
jgi:hypothetical protein